jgi:hypothetical protein
MGTTPLPWLVRLRLAIGSRTTGIIIVETKQEMQRDSMRWPRLDLKTGWTAD